MATNADIAAMLDELVTLTTLEEESPQSFKVRAYEKAKLALEAHGHDVTGLSCQRAHRHCRHREEHGLEDP